MGPKVASEGHVPSLAIRMWTRCSIWNVRPRNPVDDALSSIYGMASLNDGTTLHSDMLLVARRKSWDALARLFVGRDHKVFQLTRCELSPPTCQACQVRDAPADVLVVFGRESPTYDDLRRGLLRTWRNEQTARRLRDRSCTIYVHHRQSA